MHCFEARFRFFVVFALIFCVQGQSSLSNYRTNNPNRSDDFPSTERNHPSIICMNIEPQRSLDMNQIMGRWYGTEIIIHTQDVPGVYNYESCVGIQISDITDQMQDFHFNNRRTGGSLQHHDQYRPQQHQQNGQRQYPGQNFNYSPQQTRYLRLVWTERDDTLEYIFNYTATSPGIWSNFDEQRGSFVALNHYTQFSGTVQVVKAVNDHLVLTFCGNDVKSSIYTIVLSRSQEGLSPQMLYSIRSLLSSRHLSIDTIRKVCYSAAAGLTATLKIILLLVVASLFRKF